MTPSFMWLAVKVVALLLLTERSGKCFNETMNKHYHNAIMYNRPACCMNYCPTLQLCMISRSGRLLWPKHLQVHNRRMSPSCVS